jgi:hypothetical protein
MKHQYDPEDEYVVTRRLIVRSALLRDPMRYAYGRLRYVFFLLAARVRGL